MAFCGYVVSYPHLRDVRANFDNRACEFVPNGQGRLDPARSPIVPLPNMKVGSAYACRLNPDEDLVSTYRWDRNVVDDQTGLRPRLADGLHRFGHLIVLVVQHPSI